MYIKIKYGEQVFVFFELNRSLIKIKIFTDCESLGGKITRTISLNVFEWVKERDSSQHMVHTEFISCGSVET